MKRNYALPMLLALLGFLAVAADKPPTSAQSKPSLAGTWEMSMSKYGDQKELTPMGDEIKALKFVTDTHWVWVHIDPKTKKISNSMGGRYELKGDSYIETPEFAVDSMLEFVGKPQKFTVKIEGDQWTHSGELSNGQKLVEVWKRVK